MVRELQDSLSDAFKFSEAPGGAVRLRTPLTYPDGTLIDLFLIARDDGAVVVTDHGETTGWLQMRSDKSITRSQTDSMARICQSLYVSREEGGVLAISEDHRSLAESVARVVQAAVLISHVEFN